MVTIVGASTTISNSIGQGEILTTPIQMANFASAIENRDFYKPHFVKKIIRQILILKKMLHPLIKKTLR